MKGAINSLEELIGSIELQLDDNIESCVKALLKIKKHSSKGVFRNQIVSIKSKELLRRIDQANSKDCFSIYCSTIVLIECYKKSHKRSVS